MELSFELSAGTVISYKILSPNEDIIYHRDYAENIQIKVEKKLRGGRKNKSEIKIYLSKIKT